MAGPFDLGFDGLVLAPSGSAFSCSPEDLTISEASRGTERGCLLRGGLTLLVNLLSSSLAFHKFFYINVIGVHRAHLHLRQVS